MKNKLITHFHLKHQMPKDGIHQKSTIYYRITLNGKRTELSTQQKVESSLWDKSAERVKGRSEEARLTNNKLVSLENKVNKLFLKLDDSNRIISVKDLLDELHGRTGESVTLIVAFKSLIKTMEKTVNIDYTPKTIQRYNSSMNSLIDFLKESHIDKNISLVQLDHEFIRNFEIYLKTTRKLQHNSFTKDIKNLKRVINYSIENNWIEVDPFRGFSCNYRNNERDILTQEEVDQIYQKELQNKRLERIRDIFIFQIYTGFSYSDLNALTYENLHIGIDGNKWIITFRQKTSERSSVPLLPRAEEILLKYADDPVCSATNSILPVPSNQKMNKYLKEISKICNLKKKITTHTARHTFATTITLTNGVPIESVSKMLGHKDLKTTQIYSKVLDLKVADDMKKLKQVLFPKEAQADTKSNT